MPYATSFENIKIYYEEKGEGRPLLLIMGLGADGNVWQPHSDELQKHFRCIIPDNRGAGRSDKPERAYTTDEMADDMVAVLDSAGIEKASVAGISMGSCIAQKIAVKYPGRIEKIVLVSAWAACDLYTKTLFKNMKKVRENLSPDGFAEYLSLIIYSPHYYDAFFMNPPEKNADGNDGYMPLHAFKAQCCACAEHNAYGELEKITAPALITVGDCDIFTPLRFSLEINKKIKYSELSVYKNAGHVHHFEEVSRFNREVIEFLKK